MKSGDGRRTQRRASMVKAAKGKNGRGILRINFPDYSGENTLREILWEEFFNKLEKENLAFLYQEELSSGEQSRFFKIIDSDNADKHK